MKTAKNPNPSSTNRHSAGSPSQPPAPAGTGSPRRARASDDEIAQRAYERWQRAGANHGEDQAHWFAAEQELNGGGDSARKSPATRRAEP